MSDDAPPATCVVTVDTGPGGVRWALVSVSPGPGAAPSDVVRVRLRGRDEVLDAVAQFLDGAGLAG